PTKAICCRIFTPALPDYPAASLRDFLSGASRICERFHRTVLDEFYRIAFRKKIYHNIDELQADLDAWLVEYNYCRPHQGRWCFGKTPQLGTGPGRPPPEPGPNPAFLFERSRSSPRSTLPVSTEVECPPGRCRICRTGK